MFSIIFILFEQMQMDLNSQISQKLAMLPTHASFSGWLKQFNPILTHLAATRQQMILSHYLYSLVSYDNQPSLKYFALVDYLVKTSHSFIRGLETIIENIFVRTFVAFHQTGRVGETQQMKTFRAGWFGKMNPQILYNMKISIMNWIFVDIDLTNNTNRYKQNQKGWNYQQQNHNGYTAKRQRVEYSQERNSETNLKKRHIEDKKESSSTRSQVTKDSLTPAQLKLQKLKEFASFKCRLCGISFSHKKNLDLHQKQEIKKKIQDWKEQKLVAANKCKRVIVRQSCLQSNMWVDPEPVQVVQQQHYFFFRDYEFESRDCYFCCKPFEKWAYRNCAKVQMDSKSVSMHKSCYECLNENQKMIVS